VCLRKGEEQTITFELTYQDLAFYHSASPMHAWQQEPPSEEDAAGENDVTEEEGEVEEEGEEAARWFAEAGEYSVFVGGSSCDVSSASFRLFF
jgi:hypothetical protein